MTHAFRGKVARCSLIRHHVLAALVSRVGVEVGAVVERVDLARDLLQ